MSDENLVLLFFLLVNIFFVIFFEKIKLFYINIDKPDNKRKLHKNPVPLAGGTIIFINLLFYFLILLFSKNIFSNEIIFEKYETLIYFFLSSSLIFILGFLDDKLNYSAKFKFLVIIFIIVSILFLDKDLNITTIKFSFLNKEFYLFNLSIVFTCFCFLVFLNSFNMFDGINLQSSSYSILILSSILFLYADLLLIKIILLSLLGYSYLNGNNKSFLGDSGTLLLAFLIGYIFIKLYNLEKIDFSDEVVIYMLVPGTDLIRLFFKRIFLKKNPFSPDRFHIHHLLLLKFSKFKTLTILIFLILFPILLNYLNFSNFLIIIFFISIYTILLSKISSKA